MGSDRAVREKMHLVLSSHGQVIQEESTPGSYEVH
jgi:hypothetical protein